jgi:hypothetical protein
MKNNLWAVMIGCCFVIYGTGCATLMGSSMPGGVSVSKSTYDGSTELYLNPGWANSDMYGTLKIGARKTSKMTPTQVLLIVRNDIIKNFDFSQPNFFVKIDGTETKLSSIANNSDCSISSRSDVAHCFQEYLVELSFIEKMLAAKDVQYKLNLQGNTYVEGSLINSGMTTARTGLKDFMERVAKEFPQAASKITKI